AIQRSYWLHRRKGTRGAVRRVIEDMGFSATFAEWFEVDDEPGTFRLEVDINEVGLTQKTLAELNRLIDDAKPVSRHAARLNIAVKLTGDIWAGSTLCGGDIISIYPLDFEAEDNIFYNGVIFHDGNFNYG
ncbi:phage tail protein I, partial [Klebsiella michiganensis]